MLHLSRGIVRWRTFYQIKGILSLLLKTTLLNLDYAVARRRCLRTEILKWLITDTLLYSLTVTHHFLTKFNLEQNERYHKNLPQKKAPDYTWSKPFLCLLVYLAQVCSTKYEYTIAFKVCVLGLCLDFKTENLF